MATEQSLVSSTSSSTLPTSHSFQIPNVTQFLIIKLTSSNYLLLTSHIDGSAIAPSGTLSNGEPNSNYNDWFCYSVSESIMLHQIVRCATAKEAWDKLAVIYSTSAKTQVQQLRKQVKHFPISNETLVCDAEYHPFARAIEAQNTSVNFDELYALLLSEEMQLRLDNLAITSAVLPIANYVSIGRGSVWTIDSSANYHLAPNQENISCPVPVHDNTTLTIANGKTLPILSRGSSATFVNGHSFVLNDILYSPADIPAKQVLYQGQSKDDLYLFPMQPVHSFSPKALLATISLWHERLGHANLRVVKNILSNNKISFYSNKHFEFCHGCSVSKSLRLPFANSLFRATQPLELICSDVWGPSPVVSMDGYRYYFIQFQKLVEKYFGVPIKSFQSNWGERKYRYIIELGRALLHNVFVIYLYWTYAFDIAAYTINSLLSTHNSIQTPFELLFHVKPNYDKSRVFGFLYYLWLKPYTPHKLASKSSKCAFLRYMKIHKGVSLLES
ncbi:hypothetical protein MANES_10G062750v8 [Manihot esculenta]|uniref:Uncharacterized protein n=1 Tax=Manihot esculenta TaxID=3983 RepID=A0ACB7GYD6_MANES|nr:hypothetical protein MANES_10G062750v8 [Manihot esculenta]